MVVVESLLLHWNPLALSSSLCTTATIWCKFYVVNPALVTHTGAELLNAIKCHAQPAAVTQCQCLYLHVGPLPRDVHTQTAPLCSALNLEHPPRLPRTTLTQLVPPRNSRSRNSCSCVLRDTPFGAGSHFNCVKTSTMHSAPATAVLPPRSSPLPSFSNGASSPKPCRRAISHFSNPSTLALATVSAAPVAVAPSHADRLHTTSATRTRGSSTPGFSNPYQSCTRATPFAKWPCSNLARHADPTHLNPTTAAGQYHPSETQITRSSATHKGVLVPP